MNDGVDVANDFTGWTAPSKVDHLWGPVRLPASHRLEGMV